MSQANSFEIPKNPVLDPRSWPNNAKRILKLVFTSQRKRNYMISKHLVIGFARSFKQSRFQNFVLFSSISHTKATSILIWSRDSGKCEKTNTSNYLIFYLCCQQYIRSTIKPTLDSQQRCINSTAFFSSCMEDPIDLHTYYLATFVRALGQRRRRFGPGQLGESCRKSCRRRRSKQSLSVPLWIWSLCKVWRSGTLLLKWYRMQLRQIFRLLIDFTCSLGPCLPSYVRCMSIRPFPFSSGSSNYFWSASIIHGMYFLRHS